MNCRFFVILFIIALMISQTVSISAKDNNILSKVQSQVSKLIQAYQNESTSIAFSIVIKIYLATQIFQKQMRFLHPQHLNQQQLLILQNQNSLTCSQRMTQIVNLFKNQNWVQNYQIIGQHIKYLQKFCTNKDFKYGKNDQKYNSQILPFFGNSNGFGDNCAWCVIILRVLQNYILIRNKNVAQFVQKQFCKFFDGIIQPTCQAFIHYAGPEIIKSLINKQNSDAICLKIGYCTNPQCKIASSFLPQLKYETFKDQKPAPWEWLVHLIVDKFGNSHLPPFDLDNDTFSDISTFRGYHWRGVDCDQISSKIYPGRKIGSNFLDHDCNGIYGVNEKLQSYEQLYRSQQKTKSKRYGIVVIGDSAGAHFSLPQKYFNASMIQKGTYNDLFVRIVDQLDLPHYSAYTGHINRQSSIDKTHSVYKYARNWNMCNNNDFQNLGVNGGDSGNTWGNIKALTRNKQNDYPLLIFMELIGNDVCGSSIDGMTQPAQFKVNILKLLNWLDQTVPTGSHLMMFGLADGQMLYDNLHDAIHPLNVTYPQFYEFLNCLKISPCFGWLNTNQTARKFTTQTAKKLSKVYNQIINQHSFKNFDMVYYDFPDMQILKRKIMEDGNPKDLFERCDGFHPNGQFNSYLADWIWNTIQEKHPEWIGQKNPYNEKIKEAFGLKDIN